MATVASVSACLLVVLAIAATVCVVIADWLFSDTANAEARCTDMATLASVSAFLLVVLAVAATVCSYN